MKVSISAGDSKIKADFTGTQNAIKYLKDFDKILTRATIKLRSKIIKLWLQGKGANGKRMPKLSTTPGWFPVGSGADKKYKAFEGGYRAWKVSTGRKGIRDLNVEGHLQRGFIVNEKEKFRKVLSFTADQEDKARGNYDKANDMLTLSENIKNETIKYIKDEYWKLVNNKGVNK